jgi:glycosyltransferase involved in cell wall biosynthesis
VPNSSALVSIVIPAFVTSRRQADLLDETLTTVDQQTCGEFEVIVIDDGSPFGVEGVAAAHRRTRVIRQPNAGPAVARNLGLSASRSPYVLLLDADDHLLPPALEAGLRALAAEPAAGFAVGPREEMTYEGVPVNWSVAPPPDQRSIYAPLLAFDWYIIPPSAVLFRREVVDTIGGFRDPWGADDLDFYLRAAWSFPACCYPAPAVTRYRRYGASSSRDGERMLRSVRTVYARQWPLVQGHPRLEQAFAKGLAALTAIFRDCLVENVSDHVRGGRWRRALRSATVLARERPGRLVDAVRRGFAD